MLATNRQGTGTMTNLEFTDRYDFTEHSANGHAVAAGWIVVALANLCLILLTV